LHEVVHHLDYTLLGLGESFHTDGFFQRESSLVRQLENVARVSQPPRDAGTVRAESASEGKEIAFEGRFG
jgi:hypothetical protein